MTQTRFTYSVFARPKNKDVDGILDIVNNTMKDFGFDESVRYDAEIGTFSFTLDDNDKSDKHKAAILDTAKKVMETKYLSGVVLKFKSKELVKKEDYARSKSEVNR